MLNRSCLEHKICLVGLDNAGKTTILYQFLMNEVVHTSPTIGSIGHATELGYRVFDPPAVPMMVGAPFSTLLDPGVRPAANQFAGSFP